MVGIPGAFIPNKVRSEDPETDNEMLKGSTILNTVLRNGDTIWIEFNQDGGKVTKWENETFTRHMGKILLRRGTHTKLSKTRMTNPKSLTRNFTVIGSRRSRQQKKKEDVHFS